MLICSGGMGPWILFLRGGMSSDVWLFSLNFPTGTWVLGGLKLLSTHTMQKQLSIPQFCFCKQYSPYNGAPLNTEHRYQCGFKKHGSQFTNFIMVIFCKKKFLILFLQNYWAAHLSMKLLFKTKSLNIRINQSSKSLHVVFNP